MNLNLKAKLSSMVNKLAGKVGYAKASNIQELLPAMIASVLGIAPEKSYQQLIEGYNSWAYTGINRIAQTIASIPLKLYVYRNANTGKKLIDRGRIKLIKYNLKSLETASDRKYWLSDAGIEKQEIIDHPFIDLINHPNDILTRVSLWLETMTRMELGGICAWYMVPNQLGLPIEIWPLPLTKNAEIRPVVNNKMRLEKWIYQDGEIRTELQPNEILALKYINPSSIWEWYSPLQAQTYAYDIDMYLSKQQRAMFENGLAAGNYLTTDQQLSRNTINDIMEMIRANYAGSLKAGSPFLLHQGLKMEKTGWSPKDAMSNEVAEFARQKLLTALGTSDAGIGLLQDANRSNMDALRVAQIQEAIKPRCMIIEEPIETFLLPRYDYGLTCDFELPDLDDKDFKLKEREINLRMFYTSINEERAKEGRTPKEWGDTPWIPFSYMQYGYTPPVRGMSDQQTAQQAQQTNQQQQAQQQGQQSPGKTQSKGISDWSNIKKHQAWLNKDSQARSFENLVTQQMVGYFKNQGEEVIKRLMDIGRQIEAQYRGWSRKSVKEHIAKKGIGDNINIDQELEQEKLKALLMPVIQMAIDTAGSTMIHSLGLATPFNVMNQKIMSWLGSRMNKFSEEVSDTTFEDIKAVLREGFSEGKPLTVIADTLREKFDSYEKYRAPLIARTEIMPALNQADLWAIDQAGASDLLTKSWLSARDDAVRDTHREAEMKYTNGIPIDEQFEVGNDKMDAPGNGNLAEENINCRCTQIFSRKED